MENLAFSHRQRVLREEERLRGLKAALQGQLEERQALLAELERQIGLRQQAVEGGWLQVVFGCQHNVEVVVCISGPQ